MSLRDNALMNWALGKPLPDFAQWIEEPGRLSGETERKLQVDTDQAYPIYLEALRAKGHLQGEVTQFWLEVARRACQRDLKLGYMPKDGGLLFKLTGDKHRLRDYPVGQGAEAGAASFGRYFNDITQDY